MGTQPTTRRRFVQATVAASAQFGLYDLTSLAVLRPVRAADARLDPDRVRFGAEIEPTVQFLEDTPHDEIIERLLTRIKNGTSYRELVTALLLAGVRNIPGSDQASHRNVGGELHSVLVINSAHLASLDSPDAERWLPILWAVDQFKISQSRPPRGGGPRPPWLMRPVDESAVPVARKASQAFSEAVDNWDEVAADPAAAGLARSVGVQEVFALLCRYAARDFRYLGHKAIFVANGWRTLQCVGWQHAEPVLRSLARSLTAYFHTEGSPKQNDQPADRPWRDNAEFAVRIRDGWQDGRRDAAASAELVVTLRQGDSKQATQLVVELLNRGIHPQVVWDAVYCGSAEVLMTRPGFTSLHAVTTANAIGFVYGACRDDELRRRLLLQAASFVPLFRREMAERHGAAPTGVETRIDHLTESPQNGSPSTLDEIFADAGRQPLAAAGNALAYLRQGGDVGSLTARARQLVFRKGNDHHDYKYSSAVFEDYLKLSPEWRDRFLAAAMFQLRGTQAPDTGLANRLKSAV